MIIAGFSVISLYRGTRLLSVGVSSPLCPLFWRPDQISRGGPVSRRTRKPRCASASSRNCHHPHSEVSCYERCKHSHPISSFALRRLFPSRRSKFCLTQRISSSISNGSGLVWKKRAASRGRDREGFSCPARRLPVFVVL